MATSYSQEFKEALVSKVLTSSDQSMSAIARQAQVSVSTLHTWVHRLKNSVKPNHQDLPLSSKSSSGWKAKQRFQALLDTQDLTGEALNAYCRQHGLYKHQLQRWREDFMNAKLDDRQNKKQAAELKVQREKNKQLQRELRRKEKALAEASALLILKKKADLIWPDDEDDSS